MLADGTEGGNRLFDRLVHDTAAMLDAGVADGSMRDTSDPEMRALIVTVHGLAPLLLRDQLARAMGTPLASAAALRRMTRPMLELYTHGLYADSRHARRHRRGARGRTLDSQRAALRQGTRKPEPGPRSSEARSTRHPPDGALTVASVVTRPWKDQAMNEPTAAVSTRGLTKRYGSTPALHGIDLDIPRGQVYGVIGPNGAGKTTTMRLLLDIIRPTAGEIRVLGEAPRAGGAALRRRIGYLPGELHLESRVRGRELLAHYAEISGPVRRGAARGARRPARPRPLQAGAQPVEGQQAEARTHPGVHARARAARARRADQRTRPARATGVPRHAARREGRRADGVPQLARAQRGAADRGPRRHPPRRVAS